MVCLHVDKHKALAIIDEEMGKVAVSGNANPQFSNTVMQSFAEAQKWSESVEETYLGVASVWIALMFNRSYIAKKLVQEFHKQKTVCIEAE